MAYTFQAAVEVRRKCPHCGDDGPKSLSYVRRVFDWQLYLIAGVLTLGIGFLLPVWTKPLYELRCQKCGRYFRRKWWER